MTIHDLTIAKIQQLPEPLAQEVSDFIDFLLVKQTRCSGSDGSTLGKPSTWLNWASRIICGT